MEIRNVELPDILRAREERVARQQALLAQHPQTLVCFTMNIAGPVKNSDGILNAWREGLEQLRMQLSMSGLTVEQEEQRIAFTGNEAFLTVSAEPLHVKALAVELEEQHPLGRLFDIDVLRPDGTKVDRQEVNSPPRRCLICGQPAAACASRRVHSVQTLQQATNERITRYFSGKFADQMAGLAAKALLYEVAVTPKPGLVDRNNNGAHRDMDFYTFLSSVTALTPYFRDMVRAGVETAEASGDVTFQKLRFLGKTAEAAMRRATGNVNTHKGAIFSVGILCGALGRLHGRQETICPECVFSEAAEVAEAQFAAFRQSADRQPETVGSRLFREHGITGVRGEAAAGFPSVREIGLPVLKQALEQGLSRDEAGYTALLHLMANVTDTNLIARSDYATQRQIQQTLRGNLIESIREVEALDRDFIARNLSPGGCADLLAVSWMMYFLDQKTGESE